MPRFRTGRRRSKRTISVVPVRLWIAGSEDSHLAHTLDVSNHGVKLAGCRGEFKVGDKIEVLYRHKHAQFRVAWISAREGSSAKHIGAECLERESKSGGTDFPEQKDETMKKSERDQSECRSSMRKREDMGFRNAPNVGREYLQLSC